MALKVGELFASFDLDASGMTGTIRTIESSLEGIGASMVKSGSTLNQAITEPIKNIGKNILSAGMDFTAQMSRVGAISGASADEMKKLNDEALRMGSTTQFTATEAGYALEYMAMAGWKSDQMMEGLAPIMNLAAASGENLADVSDIVTDALTAFGLKAGDAAHFSDVLAAASSNSNTNVGLMGETFKYVAPVAGALGYKVEDTAVAIGLMANAGIKGSQAGTALRSMLSRMVNPTDAVEGAMKKLGVSLTDTSGKMLPLDTLLRNMRKSFNGLTESEKASYAATLAGQEGMSGLLAIIGASDKDFEDLTNAVNNCKDATSEMASTVLDNARGDWTLFNSAVEGAYVGLFKLNEEAIRGTIQGMTRLVDGFSKLSAPMKQAILKTGLLAAALGPAMIYVGKFLLIVGKIAPALAALVSPLGIVAGTMALFAAASIDAGNEIGKAFEKAASVGSKKLGKLDETIQQTIANISGRIPALASSLKRGISDIVPVMTTLAVDTIGSLADVVADNADEMGEVGTEILTSVMNGFATSAPQLIPSMASAAVSALNAAISSAPKLLESGINLAAGIVKGFQQTDWKSLGLSTVTALRDAFSDSGDVIRSELEKIDWKSVWGSVTQSASSLKEKIVTLAGDIRVWLGDNVGDLSSIWDKITLNAGNLKTKVDEQAGKIVDWIGEKLKGMNADDILAKVGDLSSVASGIISSIISAKVNYVAEAGKLIESFVGGLSGFSGWDVFSAAFMTVASGIVGGIVSGVQGVASAAADIAGAIAGILGTINENDFGTSVGTLAANLFDLIVNGINDVATTPDLSRFMTNIGLGIANGISFVGDVAGELVKYILSPEGLATVIGCGESIASAIVMGIGQGLMGLTAGVIDLFESIFNASITSVLGWFGIERDAMVDAMNDMSFEGVDGEKITGRMLNAMIGADNYYTVAEQAGAYVSLVQAGFEEQANMADFTPAGAALSKAISDGFFASNPEEEAKAMAALIATGMDDGFAEHNLELYMSGMEMFSQIYDGMEQSSEILIPLLKALGLKIPATFEEALSGEGVWSSVTNATTEGLSGVTEAAEALYNEAGKNLPQTYKDGVITGVTEAQEELNNTMSTSASSATDPANFTDAQTNAQTNGENVGSSTSEGIKSKETEIQTATQGVLDLMNSTFTPIVQDFGTTSRNAMTSVCSVVNAMSPSATLAVSNAMNSAVSAARSIMNSSAGYSLGRDIMQGAVNGINSMSGMLASAARSAVSRAVSAMRSAANAHSPSRETIALGQDMDEGAAIGLSGGQMIKAAAKAVEGAVHAMSAGASISDPASGTVLSARANARQTANETARSLSSGGDREAMAHAIGDRIADRLIESGALGGDVNMNGEKVGEISAPAVSKKIARKSKQTVTGRSAQGVLA